MLFSVSSLQDKSKDYLVSVSGRVIKIFCTKGKCCTTPGARHMRRKRAVVKLNYLGHLRGQSAEIPPVGFSDPKKQFCTETFLISGSDQKLFTVKKMIMD